MVIGGDKLLLSPATIPDKNTQKILMKTLRESIDKYEDGTIDRIALMQAKVKNRYNEKKAIMTGNRKI